MEEKVKLLQGSQRLTNRYRLESLGHNSEGYESQIFKISNPKFDAS